MKKIIISVFALFMMLFMRKVEMVWADELSDVELSINGMQILEDFDAEIIEQAIDIVSISANEKSQEEIEDYALDFMQGSQPENSMRILFSCPMYGMDNSLTGYYITFLRDGVPNGYTLISFLHTGSPIVEFSFEGLGIFTNIENPSFYVNSNAVKYIGPDQFYVNSNNLLEQDKYVSLYDGSDITKIDVIERYQIVLNDLYDQVSKNNTCDENARSYEEGIIDWDASILDYSSIYKIPNFGAGTTYWEMSDFESRLHCGPTACTNILWYWGWKYSSSYTNNVTHMVLANQSQDGIDTARKVFDRVDRGIRNFNISQGATFDGVINGFRYYFAAPEGTGVWNYRTVYGFVNIYLAMPEGCPFYMVMYTDPELTNGHAVMALGSVKDILDNKYIVVMDGWNNGGRWVRNNYFYNVKGHKIWVSCA